jgi:hypothetical protein
MLPQSGATVRDEDGNVDNVIAPQQLTEALETIFNEGHRLRVTWQVIPDDDPHQDPSASGAVVREGRASEWDFKYDRLQDVGWTIQFEWASRGTTPSKPVAVRKKKIADAVNDLGAASLAFNSSLTPTIIASNKSITKSASIFTLGQLSQLAALPKTYANQLTNDITRITTQMQSLANLAQQVESEPASLKSSGVGLARSLVASANSTLDAFGRVCSENTTNKPTVASVVRGYLYFSGIGLSSAGVASAAYETLVALQEVLVSQAPMQGEQSRAQANATVSDVLATYVVRAGDTPSSVSSKFYGSPDYAFDILRANRLPWHQPALPIGRPVIIPRLGNSRGIAGL